MSPAETAAAMHNDGGTPFDAAVAGHFLYGVVISTPRLFLLARPVRSDEPDQWCNLAHIPSEPDAWYIWCAVGSLEELADAGRPYLDGKNLLAFHRGGPPRVMQISRLTAHAKPKYKRRDERSSPLQRAEPAEF